MRSGAPGFATATLAAVVFAATFNPSALAGNPRSSRTPALSFAKRTWTFHDLGFTPDRYVAPQGFARPSLRYRLPSGVRQGRQGWWLIHLHLRVHVNPRAAPGSAIVAASVDQVGCAYIRLDPAGRHGGSGVAVTTVGIVDGTTTSRSGTPVIDIRFSNYLPFPGVRAGLNELLFIVPPSSLIRQIDVMGDSSLELSPLSPARIKLTERLATTKTTVGHAVRVTGTVRNLGLRAAERVGLSLDTEAGVSVESGADTRHIGELRHGNVRRFVFTVRPRLAGRFPIGVSARSSSNQTAAIAYLEVTPAAVAHKSRFWWPVLESLAAAALLLGAAWLSRLAPRRERDVLAGVVAGLVSLLFWLAIIGATVAASLAIAAGTLFLVLALSLPMARRGRGGWIAAAAVALVGLLANGVLLIVLAAAGGE